MKENRYLLSLDDYEHRLVIKCINNTRNDVIKQGQDAEDYGNLLIKAAEAPKKRVKINYER